MDLQTTARLFRPTPSALNRIAIGLYWSAGILLAVAGVLIVRVMWWATTPEAAVRAVFIAVAFGLPAIVLFVLAYWLDWRADQIEGIRQNDE